MSAGVDVMAARAAEILAETHSDGTRIGREHLAIRVARMEQRDAAVSALIAADREYDEARAAFDAKCRPATHTRGAAQPKHGDPVVQRLHEAIRRRAASLARVSGGAA